MCDQQKVVNVSEQNNFDRQGDFRFQHVIWPKAFMRSVVSVLTTLAIPSAGEV